MADLCGIPSFKSSDLEGGPLRGAEGSRFTKS